MKNLKFHLLTLVHLAFLVDSAEAHYDPNIGRWVNRDPIEEDGRISLFKVMHNDGLNLSQLAIDLLLLLLAWRVVIIGQRIVRQRRIRGK